MYMCCIQGELYITPREEKSTHGLELQYA